MNKFESSGIPNLVNNKEKTLQDAENEKRTELLSYIKSKRAERDQLIQESNSIPNKLLNIVGRGDRDGLQFKAKVSQGDLYYFTKRELSSIDSERLRHAEKVVLDTVTLPIDAQRDLQRKEMNDTEINEKKEIVSRFVPENLILSLNHPDLRSKIFYSLSSFLKTEGLRSTIQLEHINHEQGHEEGFGLSVARSSLEGLVNSLQDSNSVEEIVKTGGLGLLEELTYVYEDGFTQEIKDTIAVSIIKNKHLFEFDRFLRHNSVIRSILESKESENFLEYASEQIEGYVRDENWSATNEVFFSYSDEIRNIAKEKLDGYLTEKFQIRFEDVRFAWGLHPQGRKSGYMSLSRNIEKMHELEAKRPGGAKILYEEFSIKEFNRYPIEVLVDQIDHKDQDVPYGAIMYSNEDHNQVFDRDNDLIQSMFDQTKDHGFHLRISEFDSRYSFIKRLAALNSKYGDKNKISYLLLGAHGTKDGFSADYFNRVTTEDLQGEGVARIKDYLVENPEIIMASCSTGQEGGIGQEISRVYSSKVHAPTEPTNVELINVSFQDGKPIFDVKYSDEVLQEYEQGQRM